MIEIKVRDHEITVVGHANYAEYGRDIICASVSMLLQNLVKSIHDLTDDKIEYDLKAGQAFIKYRNLSEKSKTLIDSFLLVFAALQMLIRIMFGLCNYYDRKVVKLSFC